MNWKIIPEEKVIVSKGWCIKPEMAVLLGLFIQTKPSPDRYSDYVNIRIGTCLRSEAEKGSRLNMLYIQNFDTPLISEITGNVTVPAKQVLERHREDLPTDHRTIILELVLWSELQEVQFDLGGKKNTCSIWFRCIKNHPMALIPRSGLLDYFAQTDNLVTH